MKTKNKSLFLLKIGIVLTLIFCSIPCFNVKADETTPITITTSTKDVILVDGDTYNFVFKQSVNATTATVEISDTPFYVSEDNIAVVRSGHGTQYCDSTSWSKDHTDYENNKTYFKCKKCGHKHATGGTSVSSYNGKCGNPIADANWSATATITVLANYEKLDGKTLTVTMGGKTFTWNITIDKPAPRISSNLTAVGNELTFDRSGQTKYVNFTIDQATESSLFLVDKMGNPIYDLTPTQNEVIDVGAYPTDAFIQLKANNLNLEGYKIRLRAYSSETGLDNTLDIPIKYNYDAFYPWITLDGTDITAKINKVKLDGAEYSDLSFVPSTQNFFIKVNGKRISVPAPTPPTTP